MFRKLSFTCCVGLTGTLLFGAGVTTPPPAPRLSAAAIADKNVAARGGLQAWRSVKTMSLEGKLGAGGNKRASLQIPGATASASKDALQGRPTQEIYLPFVMDLERPRKLRLELQFKGQTAVQVFDGTNGWKFRPFLNRRVVEPYTDEEKKASVLQTDLDGPLVDYAVKGTRIELEGMEKVDDRDTYKLKLTLKNGTATHVWLDAQTFLETKMEGTPRRMDGMDHPVEVYYRDYRDVNGLQIPFLLETRVLPIAKTVLGLKDPPVPAEQAIIERVVINPKFEETKFSKPQI